MSRFKSEIIVNKILKLYEDSEIKFKDKSSSYSILIGKNIINHLPIKIKKICPKTKKIAIIMDNNVPKNLVKF